MSLIPEEELHREKFINLAPMVDFLFLVVALLATLAITRATLYDTNLDLVTTSTPSEKEHLPTYNNHYLINLSITSEGNYKWITEVDEYLMKDAATIQQEITKQRESGLIPKEKEKIKVLLHIDKQAPWERVAKIIFSVRELGLPIHPVYEPNTHSEKYHLGT